MKKNLSHALLIASVVLLAACATSAETYKTPEIEKSSALNNEGFTRMQNKDYVAAKPYFDRALAVEPNLAIAHLNLGAVHQNLGDAAGAATEYKLAIANDTVENGYPAVTRSTDGMVGTVSEIANRNLERMRRSAM